MIDHYGELQVGFSQLTWAKKLFDCAGRHPYTAAQDSNITRKKVTREGKSKLVKTSGLFSRALSLVLLGFIVCGTTIEAAHTHGNLIAANSTITGSTFSDPASESKTNNTLLSCSDCLICQLHQNFSATVISVPPSVVSAAIKSRIFDLTAVSSSSETNAPRRGRAPPFTL
jgi:ABC-type phosphate transport system permease subunit